MIDEIDLTLAARSLCARDEIGNVSQTRHSFKKFSKKSAERIATLVKSAYTYEVIVGSYATDRHVFNLRGERMHVHLA